MKNVSYIMVIILVMFFSSLLGQSFAFYSQQDPQWSGESMGSSGQTIGQIGCAITCVAMLLQQESTDLSIVTPSTVNAYMNSHGGYTSDGSIADWSIPASIDGTSGLQWYERTDYTNDTAANWSYIDTQLAAGRIVIAKVDFYPHDGAPITQHFVVVYAKNGPSGVPSSYLINDPYPRGYTTLEDYHDTAYDNTTFGTRTYSGNFSSSGSVSMVSGFPLSVYTPRTDITTVYFLPLEYETNAPPEDDKNLSIYFKITNPGTSSITFQNFGVECRADNSSGEIVFHCNFDPPEPITLSPGEPLTYNKRAYITDHWIDNSSRNFYFHVTYKVNGVWSSILGDAAEDNLRVYPRPTISSPSSNTWLLKAPNNPAVYYYQNGYKWQFSSESAANNLAPSWQTHYYVYPTTTINGISLPQIPSNDNTNTTPMMCGRNFVFKNPSTPDVYILEPEPGNTSPLVRRRFDSELAWNSYGYTNGSLSQLPISLTQSQYNWVISQWNQGSTIYSVSADDPSISPAITSLHGSYPNPFRNKTTIHYYTKEPGDLHVSVYNIKGCLVKNLVQSNAQTGSYSVDWDGTDNCGNKVSSGIYYIHMKTNEYQASKKMIMLK